MLLLTRRSLLPLLTLIVGLLAPPGARAAPGDLDPSFGSGGWVRLLTGEEVASVKAVAVQPDLKVVIAGREAPGNMIVLRLLPNGELDPSFGTGGKATIKTGGSEARAAAIQPDGKIVVAGGAKGPENTDFFVARFLPDGAPDPSFGGGDGIEVVPVVALKDEAFALSIGSDGRIAATGLAELPGNESALGVVVLEEDGSPDPGFGGTGALKVETATGGDEGVAVSLLDDGGVLLGDENGSGGGDGFTLVKLLPGGGFDPGFGGGDGIVTTPIPGHPTLGGRITDFAVRPDGRIVASGYGYDESASLPGYDEKFAAAGYLANGELDPTFAEGGIFSHQVAAGDEAAEAVELTPDGKVLLAGSYETESSYESTALLRLRPDGALDPGFGSGGQALRGPAAPVGDVFEAAALDAEERLVAVSTAYLGNETTSVEVSRYLGDPRLPIAVPISSPAPAQVNRAAHAKMKRVPKKVVAGRLKGFFGSASDPDGNGVQKVQIALAQKIKGAQRDGIRDSRGPPSARCFALTNRKLRFKRVKAQGGSCPPRRWLPVKGTAKWSLKFKGTLPPGNYIVYARAIDGAGLAETTFSRTLGNRYAFRVVGSS